MVEKKILKLVLLLLVLLPTVTANADDGKQTGLVVMTSSGVKTEYSLADSPRLYFDGTTVTLSTKLESKEYAPTDLLKVYLAFITSDVNTHTNSLIFKDKTKNVPLYNLNGQRVSDSYSGIVIKNGKKVLQNPDRQNFRLKKQIVRNTLKH